MGEIRSTREQAAWNAAHPPRATDVPLPPPPLAPKRLPAGLWLGIAAASILGVGGLLLWQGHVARPVAAVPAAQTPPITATPAASTPAAPLTQRDIILREMRKAYDQCLPGRADFQVSPNLHGSAMGWYSYYGVDTTNVDAEGGCAGALLGNARP
jgi:hypothetical protein